MLKEFNLPEYIKVKNKVKKFYQNQRTGNQQLYIDQSKLFKPIIDTTKDLEEKIVSDRQNLDNILVPFTRAVMRANEQALENFPSSASEISDTSHEGSTTSTPKPHDPTIIIYLDKDFDETDRKN